MKVLEKKDWSEWRLHLTCGVCYSKLEVEPTDIVAEDFEDDGPNRPGGTNYRCKCAVCDKELYIAADKIPLYLQQQAQTTSRRRE